ncbi:MAG: EamA family transporter [Oscillospiraceae bacterium]
MLQNLALRRIPANTVSLLLCTEPIFTAAAAALLLGEALSGRGWLGAGMILASLLLASWLQLREERGKI